MQKRLVIPAGGIEALDQREQFGPIEGGQPGFVPVARLPMLSAINHFPAPPASHKEEVRA